MNISTKFRCDDEGFTLIELLIVMSVILILMMMVIPNVMKITKQAHQTSAVQSIRTIGSAETSYASEYPSNGFACGLLALGGAPGSGAPTPQAAQLLADQALVAGAKSGYLFNVTNCTKVTVNNMDMFTGYTITAVPASIGKSGDRGYCMDESNIIKFDPAGGSSCTQTLQ